MSANPRLRDAMYRAYMEFFEIAERKRRWNLWDDIPWDRLDPSRNNEADAIRLETFCGVELYVPCLLYTSPSPRDLSTSRMPSSA